ncbi:hypothetical protein RRG08_025038 [Elysia crispata]|uniref:Uncharacterized protein n=1 Tax=Elysia crispata TaxID=231223 RepID=A0AAE1ANQ7_9GAST|nr:hypothetical protein RRG08_025038 [Elysia crispata]
MEWSVGLRRRRGDREAIFGFINISSIGVVIGRTARSSISGSDLHALTRSSCLRWADFQNRSRSSVTRKVPSRAEITGNIPCPLLIHRNEDGAILLVFPYPNTVSVTSVGSMAMMPALDEH